MNFIGLMQKAYLIALSKAEVNVPCCLLYRQINMIVCIGMCCVLVC